MFFGKDIFEVRSIFDIGVSIYICQTFHDPSMFFEKFSKNTTAMLEIGWNCFYAINFIELINTLKSNALTSSKVRWLNSFSTISVGQQLQQSHIILLFRSMIDYFPRELKGASLSPMTLFGPFKIIFINKYGFGFAVV